MTSSKKCLRVVVSIQGYLATVFLLEKSLSILEAQQGIEDAANSLGLLDKTSAGTWEVPRSQVEEVQRWALVTIGLLRLLSGSGSIVIAAFIHSLRQDEGYGWNWSAWNCAMALPFWACFAILFREMWEMLHVVLAGGRRGPRIRPRPTQIWYRKYLGVQGRHYAFKVMALQLITVLLQSFAKADLFGTIRETNGPDALKSSAAVQSFLALILCNIVFPALVFAIPNCVPSRVMAASMDAFLDVGYMVTSIWLYIGFATQESLSTIFLGNFWNYISLYICVSHVLCVCRSLESADWAALFQVQHAAPVKKDRSREKAGQERMRVKREGVSREKVSQESGEVKKEGGSRKNAGQGRTRSREKVIQGRSREKVSQERRRVNAGQGRTWAKGEGGSRKKASRERRRVKGERGGQGRRQVKREGWSREKAAQGITQVNGEGRSREKEKAGQERTQVEGEGRSRQVNAGQGRRRVKGEGKSRKKAGQGRSMQVKGERRSRKNIGQERTRAKAGQCRAREKVSRERTRAKAGQCKSREKAGQGRR
eukprot:Skav212649  [mRNA]  locus=scaffold681:110885:115003:+ [translate_table: standard]